MRLYLGHFAVLRTHSTIDEVLRGHDKVTFQRFRCIPNEVGRDGFEMVVGMSDSRFSDIYCRYYGLRGRFASQICDIDRCTLKQSFRI
jgi:hypothetical protein